MAGKKKGKAKQAAEPPSVLGNLSGTRPERIGGSRRQERPAAEPASASQAKVAASSRPKAPASRRAAKPAAGPAAPPRTATSRRPSAGRARRPAAVSAGAPRLGARARPNRPTTPPRGTELVSTAIQAAGELAQIGLTVGGQMVKRAVDRLPKP